MIGRRVRLPADPSLLGDVDDVLPDGRVTVAWDRVDVEWGEHPRGGTRSTHAVAELEDVTRPIEAFLAVGEA